MASLYQQLVNRVNDLAVWVGDTIQLRGFKAGGTDGQVPVKSGSGDFAWAWGDMTGGGTTLTNYSQITSLTGYPASFPSAWGTLSDIPSTFTPSAHTHGNLTNDGKIGTTAGLPIITSTAGLLVTGTFGTTAGTFCAGDDSRVVGAMAASGGTMTNGTIAGTVTFGTGADVNFNVALKRPEAIVIACSDETTALTTGTAKVTFLMPYAFTLTAILASVTEAPTGASLIVDVNEAGSTIMTTNKLVIEATETSTLTATTQPTLTDTALAANAVITIDIDQVGTGGGKGLKVTLIGYQT